MWLIVWDYPAESLGATFYRHFNDLDERFGPDLRRIQRSVVLCRSEEAKNELLKLLRQYEDEVRVFRVVEEE